MYLKAWGFIATIFMLSACGTNKKWIDTQQFNYFQQSADSLLRPHVNPVIIKAKDPIEIQVLSNSLNQDQAAIFNQGAIARESDAKTTNNNPAKNQYIVDEEGYIQMHILGKIQAAGLTCTALSASIQKAILQSELIKDPIVKVNFIQMKINVLGEVKAPGVKIFPTDRVTIFDGIAASGDLTDVAQRNNILIIRENDGVQKTIHVNMLDLKLVEKDGFQLLQNDVVYVPANNMKIRQLEEDPMAAKRLQMGLSIASISVVLINLLLIFIK